jgi:hypothetical protein
MLSTQAWQFAVHAKLVYVLGVSRPIEYENAHTFTPLILDRARRDRYAMSPEKRERAVFMKKTFVGMVERTAQWDRSKEAHEQPGFADHAAYMGALEQDGFIAMAGLLAESEHILFVFLADSEEQVRERLAQDPWQRSGMARLIRLEEAHFRIGAPAGAGG